MKPSQILTRTIAPLGILGAIAFQVTIANAADVIWDGGATTLDLSAGANWSSDTVPSVAAGDTAIWNGSAFGPLSLSYSGTEFAGVFQTPGINLSITGTQTDAVTIDAAAGNSSGMRVNNITIESNAGAFTLGSGAGAFNMTLGGDTGQTHTWTNDSSNVATVNADVAFGLGGGGTHTLALAGSGNWTFNNIIGQGTGMLTVSKSGTGTVTLNNANTYTGGFILNSGTVNLGNAGALGGAGGSLTINGGTIDNTSGVALTTPAKPSLWNGDFTFMGTNSLNLNGGAVTVGGAGMTRTVNVVANTLSTGVITSPIGITKIGAGSLFMASTNNGTNIGGILDIQAGKVLMAADMVLGGLTGSGTLEHGGGDARWLFINNATENTFSGSILDNPNVAAARIGFVKRGVGNLRLTGNNAFNHRFAIENGTVTMTGTNSAGAAGGAERMALVGSIANQSGILAIEGGTFNATRTGGASFAVAPFANTRGVLRMTSGALNAAADFFVADGAGSYGAVNLSGGTITTGNWFALGRTGNGILTMTGGAIQVNADNYVHGSFAGTTGVTTMTGGTVTIANGALMIGETGAGIFTIAGTGAVNINGVNGLFLSTGTGPGTANLNGGTITTPVVKKGNGSGVVNFDGGTLVATLGGNFMQGLSAAYVRAGGATFNTNGNNITVAQPLLAPAGSGVSAIAVNTGGAGYIDAPIVALTGGTGTGATAIANVVNGVVTSFAITNPGTGYQPGDVLTATLTGGGATTAATAGAFSFSANTSGGLTKSGPGALTLSSANTYAGITNVQEGTLLLANATGSATGTGAINLAGGTTLCGTGTAAGVATVATGAIVAPGNNGVGTLSLGGLTLEAGTFLDFEFVDSDNRDFINVTGNNGLVINGGSLRTFQAGTTSPFAANGVYNILGFTGAIGGTGVSALSVDAATQDITKTYTIGSTSGFVTLTVAPAGVQTNFWNLNANGVWGVAGNWSLNAVPDAPGVLVSFGGGGTPITAPRIVDVTADHTVGTISFNSVQPYTISSVANTLQLDGGIEPVAQVTNSQGTHTLAVALAALSPTTQFTVLGLADVINAAGAITGQTNLVKNGAGTLRLTAANSFAGSTTVSNGTLAVSGAGTLGDLTNTLTVSGGTVDLGSTTQASGALTMTGGAINNGILLPASVTVNGAGNAQIAANLSGNTTVTKDGTGTLTLSGNNSYSGSTIVNGGTLAIASANALGMPDTAIFFNAGALQVTGTTATTLGSNRVLFGFPTSVEITTPENNFTIPQAVTSATALVKLGPGTLTLTGANQFATAAATSIQAGRVVFDGGSYTGANANNGIGIEIAPANGSTAAMTVQNGAVITTGRTIVGGNTGNGTGGSATLDMSGGTLNSAFWFAIGSQGTGSSTVNLTGGTVNVNSGGGTHLEVAVFGAANGTLNISGDAQMNIWNNGNLQMGVGNNGAGNGTVTQSGGSVNFFTDAGITPGGTGGLRMGSGTGRTGTYTYNLNGGVLATPAITRVSGAANFNFNGGTLRAVVGNAAYIANTIATTVKAGGAKIDTNGMNIGIPGVLAHDAALGATPDGGLLKQGAGTLTLFGVNTYTGATVVEAGTLALTGSISGSSAINVKVGATLDVSGVGLGFAVATGQTLRGAGNIVGNVAMNSGSLLSPGDGPGVMTFNGNLNLTAAVAVTASHALVFELGSLASSDGVTLATGTLNLGAALAFDDFGFTTLPGVAMDTYTLFATSNVLNGALDLNPNLLTGDLGGGLTGRLELADGNTDLVLVVVPEPGSAVMLLGGLGVLAANRRRRKE